MFLFYTPWKHRKTFGFLVFLGSNKVEALTKNGLTNPTALLVKFNFYVNFLTAGLSWENIVEKKWVGDWILTNKNQSWGVLLKKLFLKIYNINRKTTVLGSVFCKKTMSSSNRMEQKTYRSKIHQQQTHSGENLFFAVATFEGLSVVSFQSKKTCNILWSLREPSSDFQRRQDQINTVHER